MFARSLIFATALMGSVASAQTPSPANPTAPAANGDTVAKPPAHDQKHPTPQPKPATGKTPTDDTAPPVAPPPPPDKIQPAPGTDVPTKEPARPMPGQEPSPQPAQPSAPPPH
jgi:hypothetical protein